MQREVGGRIGMGKTCEPTAFSFQCMTKFTTKKKSAIRDKVIGKKWMVAQTIKRLLTMQETQVQSLAWEDPLKEEMATHSSILAWKIPRTEECGRLQSMGSQRVRHD